MFGQHNTGASKVSLLDAFNNLLQLHRPDLLSDSSRALTTYSFSLLQAIRCFWAVPPHTSTLGNNTRLEGTDSRAVV